MNTAADYHTRARPDDERRAFRQYVELCTVEPELVRLLLDAMRDQPSTDEFYAKFKPRILGVAGYGARQASLKTHRAYDVVYEVIYSWVSE